MDISAVSSAERRQGRIETLPSFETFAERYDAGAPQVVWTRLVADLETPVSAYLKLAAGKPSTNPSDELPARIRSRAAPTRGRYSVIGLEPDLVWRAEATRP